MIQENFAMYGFYTVIQNFRTYQWQLCILLCITLKRKTMTVTFLMKFVVKELKTFIVLSIVIFQNLLSCTLGFQMNLRDLFMNNSSSEAKCLSVKPLRKSSNNVNTCADLSVCCFVWSQKLNDQNSTFISVFDLNQWYKEQMPSKFIF